MPKSLNHTTGKPLILAVDDDPRQLQLLRDFLEMSGFTALMASTVKEALAIASDRLPQIIILDVNLSGENQGFEICSILKSQAPTRNIPVIFLSARLMSEEDKVRGLRCGAIDYLVKPVEWKVLEAKLRALLRTPCRGDDNTSDRFQEARRKILVVDDSPTQQEIVRRTLENSGFDIIATNSSDRALPLAVSREPNLIILDLVMPRPNGLEVCGQLAQCPSTKKIPVMIVSAVDNEAEILRTATFQAGARAFLSKPIDPNQLLMEVQRLLGNMSKTPLQSRRPEETSSSILIKGPIRVDIKTRDVWANRRLIKPLSPKLFDLLVLLIHYADEGAAREKLFAELWGGENENLKVVDVNISRLREHLGPQSKRWIKQVKGVYRLAL